MPQLAVLTCHYNPCGYQTRERNLRTFLEHMSQQGAQVFVVEAILGDSKQGSQNRASPVLSGTLPAGVTVLRVESGDVLWQKECLLNWGLTQIPAHFDRIAWLDADLIFENPRWIEETLRVLETKAVAQLFSEVIRLPEGTTDPNAPGAESWTGFARVLSKAPQLLLRGDFDRHGHTGFAWAARREILQSDPLRLDPGFYDACVTGSGDHVMAHAFAGDWDSACLSRVFGDNRKHLSHFVDWAERIYPKVRARVGVVPGRILHLWHGATEKRRYVLRNRELAEMGFDPRTDLVRSTDGLWNWNTDRPDLHQWAIDYFKHRDEDGALA